VYGDYGLSNGASFNDLEEPLTQFSRSRYYFDVEYLINDFRYGHSYCGRRIGNCTQTFEWYQFEWSSVTYNPDFKVTIIQRHLRKWYSIELYLRWPTNRKSYYDLSKGAIFNDLERPLPPEAPISKSLHSLTLHVSVTIRDT